MEACLKNVANDNEKKKILRLKILYRPRRSVKDAEIRPNLYGVNQVLLPG